jgi:hypothetical protein
MAHENPDSNNPDGTDTNNQQPKALTNEDVANIANSAITAQLKRFMEKQLPGLFEQHLKPITERLAAPQTPPEGGEGGGKKGKQDPEMLAMAQKVADMEKALQSERDRVTAAEKKNREDRAYAELRTSLEGKVRPEFIDIVAENLFHVKKAVEFDDAGNPLFKTKRAPLYAGAEAEEVSLPLRDGVGEFLKSEFAKPYLPAPSAGAGSTPLPKRGPSPVQAGTDFSKPAASEADKARRAAERARIARQRMGQQ